MKIEEAINIMEPGAEPTDEQLDRIQEDADLREACQDIMIMQGILAEEKESAEPRPELPVKDNASSFPRILMIALAAAAVFAGVFFLLHPKQPSTKTSPDTSSLLSDAITITTPDGHPQALDLVKEDNMPDAVYTVVASTPKKSTATIATSETVTTESIVTIPYGHSLQIILSDGTRVYMHPGSRIVYPDPFTGSERKVKLSGEAYFCVADDPTRPFIVHTEQGDVRDYGTEFNVCSENEKTEVVLIEGRVGVTTKSKEHLLQPGQMATLDINQPEPVVQAVDIDPYTSWRDGYFYFNEETLGDIITQLACYYNLRVECQNPDLLRLRMRYIIPRNSPETYAVEILNRLQRGHIVLEGDRIVVK